MKRFGWIGLLALSAMLACAPKDNGDAVETRRATSLQTTAPLEMQSIRRSQLSAIDSLMWQQPDSALARLLPYFDTCCRDAMLASLDIPDDDSLETQALRLYNRHYANLLLAELLYKNDCAQTNRKELLQAVAYFDSLADTRGVSLHPNRRRRDARHASAQNMPATIAFLDARAHYINGVGYYENDSVVDACKEYLKALEVMENHFEEKELVGKKAKFMTYTYNRLGDMFSEQFMMEPAIVCYKNSYEYSLISPISAYSVSNALYLIGKQFNMKGDLDSANYYYSEALANMPDSTKLFYRNVVSNQAILFYQINHQAEPSIKSMKQMAISAEDDDEKQTRYFVLGSIYFEEGLYDSALLYLESVLEYNKDIVSKTQAAQYLHVIYDSLGNGEKSDECMRFLAHQKKSEGQDKALVSRLESLFQKYLNKKLEKQSKQEQLKAYRKARAVIIPIAVMVVLFIIILAKLRGKKLLRDKEERHQQEMETERQTHKMQQAALSGRLKRSNEELRDISKQLEQTLSRNILESDASNDYAAFINAPICLYIVELVHKRQFKSRMDYLIYKDDALGKEQILALRNVAETHLARFVSLIRKQFPKLTDNDMDYCYLFLLGLSEADISALMQRAYTTVCDRSRKINRIIGADDSIYHSLHDMLIK